MDEILSILHTLQERIESIEVSIEELKLNHRPMSSKDFISCLRNESGQEINEFLESIKITVDDIKILLEEKTYSFILNKINFNSGMRVFNRNKNTIYILKEGKWTTMQKEDIILVKTTIYTKVRDEYRKMVKDSHTHLDIPKIKELSYLEQREIVSELNDRKHLTFKHQLYKIIGDHITS